MKTNNMIKKKMYRSNNSKLGVLRSLLLAIISISLGILSWEKNDVVPDEDISQHCNIVLVEDNITSRPLGPTTMCMLSRAAN